MLCIGSCAPLLIQQHIHLSGFKRSWNEYKRGFGDTNSNYWIGNDMLSYLTTNDNYTLRFDLQLRNTGNWYYAEYSTFVVLPEAHNYKLQVSGYSGNIGFDAFNMYHNGQMFSTYDRDNDKWPAVNCAVFFGGGFWYKASTNCGVNATKKYFFQWFRQRGGKELQKSRMWLQCK